MNEATWLPNLVGGTSIWKLAVDLNEPKYLDGRLLVPETEGSESLPVTVRWDLTGLIPLREAREKYPEDTRVAIDEFQGALERVAKVFATPNSGFDKYKDAFTVPSLDADDGAHYFYSAEKKKLFVVNWGASPRSMGSKTEYVFGYEDWGKHWSQREVVADAALAAVAASAVAGGPSADTPSSSTAPNDDRTAPEKPQDPKARPWWIWPLVGLLAIVLVLLALLLLKACGEGDKDASADAADAPSEAALHDDASGAPADDGTSEAGGQDDGNDATADPQGSGASDAAAPGAFDGSAVDTDDDFPVEPSGGGGAGSGDGAGGAGGGGGGAGAGTSGGAGASGGVGASGGAGAGGGDEGPIIIKIGPGGGQKTSAHRKHYSDGATRWRISAGAYKVSRSESQGTRFDVWLSPGESFEGVRVEWQDEAGAWHVH